MNNKFPTDIFSLVECGGNDFLNKNKIWPVDDKKFFKIASKLRDKHNQECKKLNNLERYVANVDFGFIYFVIYHINFKILEKILKKKKIKILINQNSLPFVKPNFYNLSNPLPNKQNKLKLQIKKIILNFFYKIIFFNKKKNAIDVGGFNLSKIQYALKKNTRLIKEYPQLALQNINTKDKKNEKYTEFFKNIFLFISKDIENKFRIKLDLKKIVKVSSIRLNIIEKKISQFKCKFKSNLLFASNTYDNQIRIIAAIYKLNRKKSYGFDHGLHAHGILNKSLLYTNQIYPFTDFVTISKKSSESLSQFKIKNHLFLELKKIKLHNIQSKFLRQNFNYFKKIENSKKIRKVMVMGWPMNSRKYFEDAKFAFFYDRIFYEINLIKKLKEKNFYVIYKPHPERKSLIKYFFKDIADEIIFEKFENKNILKKTDALIYAHTTSTTFGYALCSNLNIFLLDHEKVYTLEQKNLLKKRVNFVNFDLKSTKDKNYDNLLKFLEKDQKKINYDYVRKFLL
jgi:hypothetical protein